MRRLLIDAGNTRLKLAQADGAHWQEVQNFPVSASGQWRQALQQLSGIEQVWISNVAGERVAGELRAAGELLQCPTHFIVSQAAQAGVRNGYREAALLGCDRWATLIAAWHQIGAACLVVGCGTAITIDALSDQGVFLGGLILPGLTLMQHSLVSATAQLQSSEGRYADFPCNTADAMISGALQAVCGAIQRQYALLGHPEAPVLLSGGDAPLVQATLGIPVVMMDNPVLLGLLTIAQEMNGKCPNE